MKLRKLTSLAMAAAVATSLCVPAFAEATTEGAAGAAADITLWTYPVGGWGDSATVDSLLAAFSEKYPDIHVSVEYLDYTNGDDQVNTAIEGGQAPDLVLEGPERLVANWGAKGLMADLSDLFEDEASSDIYENVKVACKSTDGAYYEYPMCMVAHCMAINEAMFEKADALQYADLENHTWSTENFLKAVQAVYDSGQENVGAVYCSGQGGDQGTRALINNMYGGRFTNEEHTEYAVDSEQNQKALQTLVDQAGINFDASIAGGDEIQLFRNGTLAMAFCWNAANQNDTTNGEAGKTNSGDNIIPMQFPTEDGSAAALCGGIWGFGIFDNGDQAKIDAAKAFIRFICNDEVQGKESVKASRFFPVHTQMKDVYAGEETEEVMNMFIEKFMPAMGDYYQVVPGWAEARTAWWNMLQNVGNGNDIAAETAAFQETANAAAAQ